MFVGRGAIFDLLTFELEIKGKERNDRCIIHSLLSPLQRLLIASVEELHHISCRGKIISLIKDDLFRP